MATLQRWAPADRKGWDRIGRLACGWTVLVLLAGDYPLAVQLALIGMALVAGFWLEAFRASQARAEAEIRRPSEDLAPASRLYRPATEHTVDRRRMPRWAIDAQGRAIRPVAAG